MVTAAPWRDPGDECHRNPDFFVFSHHHISVTVADDPQRDGDDQAMSFTDKELGMDRRITRRDFMNGAAMTIGASLAPGSSLFAQAGPPAQEAQNRAGYDPPSLHGMRGSHEGSYQVAHSLRDGTFWHGAGAAMDSGESYDLVVVGGGISGLSSARFF